MPATTARIGFITQEFRAVTAGPDASVVTRHGDQARDVTEPIETFFNSEAHAQLLANERLALLSRDAVRLRHQLTDGEAVFGLDYSQAAPTAHVIDPDRSIDGDAIVVEISADTQSGRGFLTTWG